MKHNLLMTLTLLMGSCICSNAQISIRTEDSMVQTQQVEVYDSLSNFILNRDRTTILNGYPTEDLALSDLNGQFKKYIGQNIYILPLAKEERFYSRDSEYDKLRGKYYIIDGFEFKLYNNYSGGCRLENIIFKLRTEGGQQYRWEVSSYNLDDALLVGYYEKLKHKSVGNTFVYTGRSKGEPKRLIIESSLSVDTRTNQSVALEYGEEWLCTDIQLVDDGILMQLYAILTNSNGNEIKARIRNQVLQGVETNAAFFSSFMEKKEYAGWTDSLAVKYGFENASLILEKKVKIGMSGAMCLESWGIPDSMNRTILDGMEKEQWVYETGRYLYFENGILTAIQQ